MTKKNGKNFNKNFSKIAAIMLVTVGLVSCQSGQSTQILTEVKNEGPKGVSRAVISAPLQAFKDNKFAYRSALEVRDNGGFMRAPYNEQFDINQRDELPVRKVKEGFIKRFATTQIQDFTYNNGERQLAAFGVGKIAGGSKMTVIYLHGRNGNRSWGFDDERFGGNFNRVKNLLLSNGGAYISPDFTDFSENGTSDIIALLKQNRQTTLGPLILACGSLGSQICWNIANNSANNSLIDGMVLLGGMRNVQFESEFSSYIKIPIYIAHGSRDKTFLASDLENMYQGLKSKNYPVRMTLFETGNHGTPVRMIDWRQALNWIAQN